MDSARHRSTGYIARHRLLPILLGLTLFAVEAQAFLSWSDTASGSYTPKIYSKRGAVYARTTVPGANGQPQFVAFDENGQEVAYIGEAVGELAQARVVSGSWYSAMLARLEAVKTQYPALETLNKQDYEGTNLSTADKQLIAKPALAADTLTVALRPQDQRYATDGSDLVLLELPIRLDQTVDPSTRSLLLVPDGTVRYQTRHNIGYRVAYFGSTDDFDGSGVRQFDDTIYAPLAGAEVSLAYAVTGSHQTTGADGKYAMQYTLPACPGFTFGYATDAYLVLHYRRFNPHSAETKPYTLWQEGYDSCNGLGVYSLDAADTINSSARPSRIDTDFPVDLMVLAGTARIQSPAGPIEIGEATRYDHSRAALQRVAHESYDFDGDGAPDTSFLGRLTKDAEDNEFFEKTSGEQKPEVQGVWLSSRDGGGPAFDESGRTTVLPDLTRLPDWSPDFADRALLSALSVEDFQNTDLYVFRESNGSLLIERRGLRESEIERGLVGVDEDKQRFFYSLRLFGPDSGRLAIGSEIRTDAEVAQFQKAEGVVDPALHRREADHLRPGESVRIVAINRASGYIGSVTTTLQAAGQTGGSLDIAFDIDELVMGPPNLRIWAERHSRVQYGLTQGETRDQRIGYEGAGLAGDTLIDIYTEWLDSDGRPLPEGLADFGYTARLAKVLKPNQLQAVADSGGNQLSQFAIQPGRRLQVIRLPEQTVGNQHLYVQVAGEPSSRKPDFGSSKIHEGILTYRPDHFVPVKVPVFDETATDLQLAAYRLARDRAAPETELTRPEPAYQWAYRPEFQFSIYDLTVQEIRREDAAGQSEDILTLPRPVIADDDRLLELYYQLYAPSNGDNALPALDAYSYYGSQELVFALGEQEAHATVRPDGTVSFPNLDHLGQLDAEDYLTLRLYANNDTSNVLWEWAFNHSLAVTAKLPHDEMNVPAEREHRDAPPLYRLLGGLRLKYEYVLPPEAEPVDFRWTFNQDGRFCSDYGVAPNGCIEAKSKGGADAQAIYWEPLEWATDQDVVATLQAKYKLRGEDKEKVQQFRVVTRELEPANGTDEPLEGTDVAMLEQVLWQLGISPQARNPGSEGARIDSIRKGTTRTAPCVAGQEQERRVFLSFANPCASDGKGVSTELMVKRFNARNLNNRGIVDETKVNNARGTVDEETLAWIRRDWKLYVEAYTELSTHGGTFGQMSGNMATWITDAISIWQDGSGTTVPSTLTGDNYNRVLDRAGLDANSRQRGNLLTAWLAEESPYHWGDNRKHYQPTAFRMVEGGADENGSLSFSQLLYHYRFGPMPCAAHGEAQLNLYHPRDNLRTMVMHTASSDVSGGSTRRCHGGLHQAFVGGQPLRLAYNQGTSPAAQPMADFVGYLDNRDNTVHALAGTAREDDYEALAKGIGYYNGNGSRGNGYLFTVRSWPRLLKYMEYQADSKANSATVCHSCRYSITVRDHADVLAGHLRRYVWRGGTDASGQPWCFAYGEQDWQRGRSFDGTMQAAVLYQMNDPNRLYFEDPRVDSCS